ncbi:hypothetical protein GCM10008995_02280 [Halobellus salinus]|uniref:Uncharacterized protein n=1 Tax=Halobellus salinus TaxID=931585 RepID=A0A830EDX0_9EURY|nr:hypothetical protein GCM10008995_02280 [Halobellus salinus]SMP12508.1 hypothetical protein SAMN06265347_10474 [Halobellus salinus]
MCPSTSSKQTVKSTKTSSLISSSISLTRKFLSPNAEIDAENIYEVLVGATADGTSVSTLCESSEGSPPANTILYHLRTKFEPERLERVDNTLLRRNIVDLLPEQVEVCADFHLRPYYGDEDETDPLYHSEASAEPPRSTLTALYARVKNKRYTLAVSPSSR